MIRNYDVTMMMMINNKNNISLNCKCLDTVADEETSSVAVLREWIWGIVNLNQVRTHAGAIIDAIIIAEEDEFFACEAGTSAVTLSAKDAMIGFR